MSNAHGTKETLEVLNLVGVITRLVVKELRTDSLQWTDAVEFILSSEFQEKLSEAIAGVQDLPQEISDLSSSEGIELAMYALTLAKDIVFDLRSAA